LRPRPRYEEDRRADEVVGFFLSSGLTVLTTCSPHNFDLVKSLGATAVFDYRSPDCAKQIREYTNNNLKYAFDTVSLEPSAKICADALSSTSGCVYSALLKVDVPREDVENKRTMAYTAIGELFKFGDTEYPGNEEDFKFAKMFWSLSEKLLGEGKFKVHPPSVGKGGLKGVLEGLQKMREEKVSGQKLVYKVSETP